jgi:hypothetical protein
MAEDASQPTNFAQYEAAQRFNAAKQSAPAPAVVEESSDETTKSEPEGKTAAEPETADDKPIPTSEKAGAAAAADKRPAKASKPSLSDEHARLLREVTDLRKQRRELQQQPITSQPAPQAGTAAPASDEEKPPARPKLSTFQGTLDEYEKAVEKYDEDSRLFLDRQFERKKAQQQAQEQQQKIAQTYGERLGEHLKAHPDYDEEIAHTPMSALMVDIVLHQGPELGQALIEDKSEARRIQALPRDVQIFEMGKLSARLNGNGAAAAATPAVSEDEESTPAPPQPAKIPAKLGASGGSTSQINQPGHGAKTYAEFEAIEKRLRNKRR